MSRNISNSNIELITQLIKQQDIKREIQINNIHENMNEKFDSISIELNKIVDINEKILQETSPWRWVTRNPKLSALVAGIFIIGFLTLLVVVYKDHVENLIKTLISSL